MELLKQKIDPLVKSHFASRLFAKDTTLWGVRSSSEIVNRLGWVHPQHDSNELITRINECRDQLVQQGVNRFLLCGMGGSSLSAKMISASAQVPLEVLDTTDPLHVQKAISNLESTCVIVASKSGTTIETDSHLRAVIARLEDAAIDPADRLVIVTDPGSPLDSKGREIGCPVFHSDPNVGGRFSALTAFGLVPSGLAGVNVAKLVAYAQESTESLQLDSDSNPGLLLGAFISEVAADSGHFTLIAEGEFSCVHEWVVQLIAESTGKDGLGVLPIGSTSDQEDQTVSRTVNLLQAECSSPTEVDAEVDISANLVEQILLWEIATVSACKLIGVNPFDQPDVEQSKKAARQALDQAHDTRNQALVVPPVTHQIDAALAKQLQNFINASSHCGYISLQIYSSTYYCKEAQALKEFLRQVTAQPVILESGPRFLHSTGQFYKGGPKKGAFLHIIENSTADLEIPDRNFTFRDLLRAQAEGEARTLRALGKPILELELNELQDGLKAFRHVLAQDGSSHHMHAETALKQ